jgi:hypothetical protein
MCKPGPAARARLAGRQRHPGTPGDGRRQRKELMQPNRPRSGCSAAHPVGGEAGVARPPCSLRQALLADERRALPLAGCRACASGSAHLLSLLLAQEIGLGACCLLPASDLLAVAARRPDRLPAAVDGRTLSTTLVGPGGWMMRVVDGGGPGAAGQQVALGRGGVGRSASRATRPASEASLPKYVSSSPVGASIATCKAGPLAQPLHRQVGIDALTTDCRASTFIRPAAVCSGSGRLPVP